jgi:hypothetical protein
MASINWACSSGLAWSCSSFAAPAIPAMQQDAAAKIAALLK